MGRTGVRGWVDSVMLIVSWIGGDWECDCSKDPCCDNGVPARGADGVEGSVRAGRVSGGLTWVLGLTGLVGVANLLALESRWLNCVGLTCFYLW